jgi:hypothetical protein
MSNTEYFRECRGDNRLWRLGLPNNIYRI